MTYTLEIQAEVGSLDDGMPRIPAVQDLGPLMFFNLIKKFLKELVDVSHFATAGPSLTVEWTNGGFMGRRW